MTQNYVVSILTMLMNVHLTKNLLLFAWFVIESINSWVRNTWWIIIPTAKRGGGPGVGVRQKIPMQGKLSLILCAMFLQTIKEPSSSMNLVVLRSLTKSVRGVSVFLISILVYHSTCMTILSLTTGDCLLTVRHSCS